MTILRDDLSSTAYTKLDALTLTLSVPFGRVERGIATPNSHAKPDVIVSHHPAPRLSGTCHVYLYFF